LVVVEKDKEGNNYYKRAFNAQVTFILSILIYLLTWMFQACEQLNAWLGGFENILKRMSPGNFDWFLHTMLFYHTRHIIEKQHIKASSQAEDSDDDGTDD